MATKIYYSQVYLPKIKNISFGGVPICTQYTLQIYLATTSSKTERADWSQDWTQVDMEIINIGNLCEGFETNDNSYYMENIDLDFTNLGGFWTDNIFTSSTPYCEIKIVYSAPKQLAGIPFLEYTNTCVFWGVVDFDTYSYEDLADPSSVNFTKHRKYKVSCFSFLKLLKDIPVSSVRTKLKDLVDTNAITHYHSDHAKSNAQEFHFNSTWTFIRLVDIVKACFDLMMSPYESQINSLDFKSDFQFKDKQFGSTFYNIDELLIPFYATDSYGTLYYDYMVFDEGSENPKREIPKWSYYNLKNASEIFADILQTFNLVWYYNITWGGITSYDNEINIYFKSRTNATNTITMNYLKSMSTDYEVRQVIDGVKVTTPSLSDYTYPSTSINNLLTKDVRFIVNPTSTQASNCKMETNNIGKNYWVRSLFFYGGEVMFVNEIKENWYSGSSTYYRTALMQEDSKTTRDSLQRALALYNYQLFYIADKSYNLVAEYVDIEGIISGVESFEYLKPTYAISISGILYQITKIERDLFKRITKLTLNRYRK